MRPNELGPVPSLLIVRYRSSPLPIF